MDVLIDRDLCIGCEACVEICPNVFEINYSEKKAYVINPEGASLQELKQAVESCPVKCIFLENL
ncbi:ferredoxin [Desulfonauticus submarinus]